MTDTNPRDLIKRLAEELYTWLMAHRHGDVPPEIQRAITLVVEARAYLDQPEPEGPTNEEMNDLFWKHSSEIGDGRCGAGVGLAFEDAPALICEALARWGRPTIEPVPVNERLPGPEDCDEEGRCWWSAPETNTKCAVWCFGPKYPPSMFGVISWLPHHALPVPQP